MPIEEEKEEVSESLKEKKKEKPYWQTIHPGILVGGIFILILLINSMMMEGGGSYIIWIIGAVVLFFILSKKAVEEEKMVTPKEAYMLTERDCELRKRWGMFPLMAKYHISPFSDMMHRDARGIYYNWGVEIKSPWRWERPQYGTAKIMASGNERTFVTLINSIGKFTGREIQQERDVAKRPQWMRDLGKYGILEKIWIK